MMIAFIRRCLSLAAVAIVVVGFSSCNRSPAPGTGEAKRYHLEGKVVSIDKVAGSAVIDAKAIPGFMDAMAMPYTVKPASLLDQLSPGDMITADIVMQGDSYWIENVTVTKHGSEPPAQSTSSVHIPGPGDQVPDFAFTNQSGQRVSLSQYHGKVLLLTFIYTQCPFPDYCPRMTGEFAQIDRELLADQTLSGKTHLLSISIDPAHDTSRALREYGEAHAGKKTAFSHWEFVAPAAQELPQVANFFGLTVQEDGGVIVHSLSTAVVGPDGRIFRWYSGSDWKPDDLVKDAASALAGTV